MVVQSDTFTGVYLEENCHKDDRDLMHNIMMTVPLGAKISWTGYGKEMNYRLGSAVMSLDWNSNAVLVNLNTHTSGRSSSILRLSYKGLFKVKNVWFS